MRLMTVAATDTSVVHFALQKRAVNENLVQNLTIGKVQTLVQQRRLIVIQQLVARDKAFGNLAATTVARSANGKPNLRIT